MDPRYSQHNHGAQNATYPSSRGPQGYTPVGGYPVNGGYRPAGGYPVGSGPNPGNYPPVGGYTAPPAASASPAGGYGAPPGGGYGAPSGGGYAAPSGGGYAAPSGMGYRAPSGGGYGAPGGGCYGAPAGYYQQPSQVPTDNSAPQGYFFIKSRLNGLVLDIQGASRSPGARVITWQKKANDNANQLWIEDAMSGTIRTKLDPNLCMEISGNALVVNPYTPGNPNQQWMRAGDRIQARHDPNRVLDVADQNRSAGARICAWQLSNQANQAWDFEYEQGSGISVPPPNYGYQGRLFFIRSQLHGKVLQVNGGSNRGNEVRVYARRSPPEDCQLWYCDQYGVILSKVNNSALEIYLDRMTVQSYRPGDPKQQWVHEDGKVFNRNDPEKVLDIRADNTSDGAELVQYPYKHSSNQHWTLDCI